MKKNTLQRVVSAILLCAMLTNVTGLVGCADNETKTVTETQADIESQAAAESQLITQDQEVLETQDVKTYGLSTDRKAVDIVDTRLVFECALEGGTLADTLTVSDFELSYGLDSMTIESVQRLGDTRAKLTLAGEVLDEYDTGTVTLLSSGIAGGESSVSFELELLKPQAMIDYHEISMKDGILSLPITLYQCAFLQPQAADVKNYSLTGLDDPNISVSGVEIVNDMDAVVHLTANGYGDMDDVLKALDDAAAYSGAALEISGEALNTVEGAAISLDMPFASVVPQLTATKPNGDGSLQAYFLLRGYASDEIIDGAYISLGGDFLYESERAEHSYSLTPSGETHISFTVGARADDDDEAITGTITLAAGALTNPWGTLSKELTYVRSVSLEAAGLVAPDDTGDTSDTGDAGATDLGTLSTNSKLFGLSAGATEAEIVPLMRPNGPGEDPDYDGDFDFITGDEYDELFDAEIAGYFDGPGLMDATEAFDKFTDAVTNALGYVKTAVKVFGAIKSVYEIGRQAAEWFGWVEPKETATGQMLKAVKGLNTAVANLSAQVKLLTYEVIYQSKKTTIQGVENRLIGLQETIKNFDTDLTGEVRRMLRPAGIAGDDTAYETVAANALSGTWYNSLTAQEKEAALALVKSAVEKYNISAINNKRLSKAQIVAALGGEDSTACMIILGKAAQTVGAKYYSISVNGYTFHAEFTSLCRKIAQSDDNVLSAIDYLADHTYNWEKEAYPVRKNYRAYIKSVLLETANLLKICLAADNAEADTAPLISAYDLAVDYMTTGAGATVDRDSSAYNIRYGMKYCTTLNKSYQISNVDYWSDVDLPQMSKEQADLLIERCNNFNRTIREDLAAGGFEVPSNVRYIALIPTVKRETSPYVDGYYATAYKLDDKAKTLYNPLVREDIWSLFPIFGFRWTVSERKTYGLDNIILVPGYND
jgi:hypothetical protein